MKRPKSRHAINNKRVLIVVFKNCLLDKAILLYEFFPKKVYKRENIFFYYVVSMRWQGPSVLSCFDLTLMISYL